MSEETEISEEKPVTPTETTEETAEEVTKEKPEEKTKTEEEKGGFLSKLKRLFKK